LESVYLIYSLETWKLYPNKSTTQAYSFQSTFYEKHVILYLLYISSALPSFMHMLYKEKYFLWHLKRFIIELLLTVSKYKSEESITEVPTLVASKIFQNLLEREKKYW